MRLDSLFDNPRFVSITVFLGIVRGVKCKDGLSRMWITMDGPLGVFEQYGRGVDVACGCTASFCFHY